MARLGEGASERSVGLAGHAERVTPRDGVDPAGSHRGERPHASDGFGSPGPARVTSANRPRVRRAVMTA